MLLVGTGGFRQRQNRLGKLSLVELSEFGKHLQIYIHANTSLSLVFCNSICYNRGCASESQDFSRKQDKNSKMKAVILSDSHGDMSRLRKVMKMHDDADVFVHLGDGVREFAAAAALLKDKRIISVAGNCDIFYQGEMPPSEVVTQLDGFVFFFTHRHKYRAVSYTHLSPISGFLITV